MFHTFDQLEKSHPKIGATPILHKSPPTSSFTNRACTVKIGKLQNPCLFIFKKQIVTKAFNNVNNT